MNEQPQWKDAREIRIAADPLDVWAAWAEPAHVARWFSDEAQGTLEPGAEIVHVFRGHGEHRYRVVHVDAPHRLVLDGEMDGIAFRQEVRIEQQSGVTVLTLIHSGFGVIDPDSEVSQGIDSGWTMALALLKLYVERYFGRAKSSLGVYRPAHFEYDRLLEGFYRSSTGLVTWLTEGEADLHGPTADLELRGGLTLHGAVLTRTRHEISVGWEEIEGALEFKAFGAGPDSRVLGLRLTSWSEDAHRRLERLRPEMEAAVDRLLALL